jgi:hypothetical protein
MVDKGTKRQHRQLYKRIKRGCERENRQSAATRHKNARKDTRAANEASA